MPQAGVDGDDVEGFVAGIARRRKQRARTQTGSFGKLSGQVEADETYIGGKARNMHKSKREEKITGRGAHRARSRLWGC